MLSQPQPSWRRSCSITFSRFLRARSMALASLGAILPGAILASILDYRTRARTHKSSSMSGSPRHRPPLCNRSKCRDGRVEDGRGGWRPEAITPFPVPAHRTGRADFRHPALRPASSRGIRRGSSGQAFKTQQAALSVDYFKGEPPCAAPGHLVPSGEEVSYALIDIVVDRTEGRTPGSVAEVVRPTEQ